MKIEEITSIINANQIESINNKANEVANFESWLTDKISKLDENINESELMLRKLAMGETENLHQIMTALEKTKLQFTLVTQVRNKLLEGYQEVMRMQI